MNSNNMNGKSGEFVINMQEIQRRAREHIKRGAMTESYPLDVQTSLRLLDEALATELVCVLRYTHHYYAAEGLHSDAVKNEFKEHADEEQQHANQIAARIKQLGGMPNFNPSSLVSRASSQYVEGNTLIEMIQEDLIAERIAIDTYREMIHFFGDKDSTSRRMLEEILAKEEEHAEDLAGLLLTIDPRKKAEAA